MKTITGGIHIGSISTSEKELKDIAKSWVVLSIAFGIILSGGSLLSSQFLMNFVLAFVTVGVGFLLHELAHKLVAQRYGCVAEFRSFDTWLAFAVLLSFFGFIFAAPGAVLVSGPVGVKRNGIISVAGPVVNIVLAIIFLMLGNLFTEGFVGSLAQYGFFINAWLAVFNMIPFMGLDGSKVIKWDKKVYTLVMGAAVVLMVMSYS